MRFICLCFLLLFGSSSQAQSELLQSGPMVGYAEMKEVLLWVQTNAPADVHIEYGIKGARMRPLRTATVRTSPDSAFVARLIADQVLPGNTYLYTVYINGQAVDLPYPAEFQTQALWQWREEPPTFTLAAGSCTYVNEPDVDRPGRPYGGADSIFVAIHKKQPDLMLWLGDNTYLREVDWFTRRGILERWTHTRSLPEMQPLLASTHHYAIWDDHDYGPNDSDRSYLHKDKTREAFALFWGNPTTGLPGKGGITTFFQWGDIDFFLLDNRWFRSPNRCRTCDPTILGRAQIDWLIEALTYSRSPFKVVAVGGQFLSPATVFENFANHHAEDRIEILRRIEAEGITGVLFLTGDRHHTELSHLTNEAGIDIYDLTLSPLTSSAATRNEFEGNSLRVDGTYVNQRNFGILSFSGPRGQRKLTMSVHDQAGNQLWQKEIIQPTR